jgi:hypothetical protein
VKLYDSDSSTSGFDTIDISYTAPYPPSTTFNVYTKSSSSHSIDKVKNTVIGGNRVSNSDWSTITNGFSYELKSDFIGSAKHTMSFTVKWNGAGGTDPKIIINP